jgi:hypothetical protein
MSGEKMTEEMKLTAETKVAEETKLFEEKKLRILILLDLLSPWQKQKQRRLLKK